GEYYGRYDRSGEQHPGPFAKILEKCGIILQYTIVEKSSMNDVTERRNRTLKDMVRSMVSHSTLPESLWGDTLKVSSKVIAKTAGVYWNKFPENIFIK
ncbi:Ribonuclease H-like domain containing protein, partial [Trema orientale]